MTKTQSAYEVTGGGSAQCDASVVSRRGVALMLVVVAMGTATVMTTAYLLSKDNSAAIGANAHDTAASAWVAKSGADLALAVLQTQEDWVDAEPEKLLEGFAIAGGTVSVALTDLSGNPPDGTETVLAMTVVADVNGLKTVIQRIVAIQPQADLDLATDPELGEFGIFATAKIDINKDATVGSWPLSPGYRSGGGVKVGSGFVDASDLTVDAATTASSAELYVRPDAAAPLQAMTTDKTFVDGAVLQMVVPDIPALMPPDLFSLPVLWASDWTLADTSDSKWIPSGWYDCNVTVDNLDTTLTLDDSDGGLYLFENLKIQGEAILKISGDVTIGVVKNCEFKSLGAIEFADESSRVRIYVGEKFKVDDTAIGVPREIARNTDRLIEDVTEYADPSRIRVYAMTSVVGTELDPGIDFTNGSISNLIVHAPRSDIQVHHTSWVIGRLTGDSVDIKDDSGLLYDPALDRKTGFTAFNGPLYKSTGEPLDGLAAAMLSYDKSLGLDAFVAHIEANTVPKSTVVIIPGVGDPTPRDPNKAIEKLWPFIAKSMESGSWVTGDNDERQGNLYVPLDPSIFDLDKFYNDGVISATHVGQEDLDPDAEVKVPIGLGGL